MAGVQTVFLLIFWIVPQIPMKMHHFFHPPRHYFLLCTQFLQLYSVLSGLVHAYVA